VSQFFKVARILGKLIQLPRVLNLYLLDVGTVLLDHLKGVI
jgi:hypothetical protein